MLWITVGLLAVGAACGALIRLLVFVGILACGAVIAGAAMAAQGLGTALLAALVTVVILQVGYVCGVILRAIVRSRYIKVASRAPSEPPVNVPFGQKRR